MFEDDNYEDEFLESAPEDNANVLQPITPSGESNSNNDGNVSNNDLVHDVLSYLNISDPNKIQFVDDSGAVIERSWDSLNRDEQLAILTQHEDLETALDDDEIELINNIRSSKMSPNQYINQLNQQYLTQNQAPTEQSSEIDDMSDDYLYVLDLMDKVGADNITDEELEEALKNAKTNEALFKKTVDGLRLQYKTREQESMFREQEKQQQLAAQRYNNFVNTITDEIDNLNYLADQEIELTPDDKEDLADYLLTLDANGLSKFGMDMNNPKNMILAAFFMKKGPEILGELSKQILIAFKRGYERAKQDIEKKSTIVINQSSQNPNDDITFFDDDWD